MQEAGHKPGVSLYDTRLDVKEMQMGLEGKSLTREQIKQYAFIDAGINPDIRPGFATYFGMPMDVAFSQNASAMEVIEKSPAISALQKGYESNLGSHGAQVSRTNALKHVPLMDEYDTGAKSAEVIKPKAPAKLKPGTIIIGADGTPRVVTPDRINPRITPDDIVNDIAKRATSAATGSEEATRFISGSSASMTSSVASTVSSGGAARVPAAVASTSPPAATAAARTAASITAPTAARSTRSLMDNALQVGQKITRGHLGAAALGVAAAGLLFGYANRDED